MRKILLGVFFIGLLGSCAQHHEQWTGHKEHKPKSGRNRDKSIDRSYGHH